MRKLSILLVIGYPVTFFAGYAICARRSVELRPTDVHAGEVHKVVIDSEVSARPGSVASFSIERSLASVVLGNSVENITFLSELIADAKSIADLEKISQKLNEIYATTKVPFQLVIALSDRIGALCTIDQYEAMLREGLILGINHLHPDAVTKAIARRHADESLSLLRKYKLGNGDASSYQAWAVGSIEGGGADFSWFGKLTHAEQLLIIGSQTLEALRRSMPGSDFVDQYASLKSASDLTGRDRLLQNVIELQMVEAQRSKNGRDRVNAIERIADLILSEHPGDAPQQMLNAFSSGTISSTRMTDFYDFALKYTTTALSPNDAAAGVLMAVPEHQVDLFATWLQDKIQAPAYAPLARAFADKIYPIDPEAAEHWRNSANGSKN